MSERGLTALLAEAMHDADPLHADDGGDLPAFIKCPDLTEHFDFAADILDRLGHSGYAIASIEDLRGNAQIRVAATEVVRLGNQPGMDDDEWEAAMSNLEVALFPTLGDLNDALRRVERITT